MPVTPTEIMVAKVWAMGRVVLAASWVSLTFVIRGALHVPIEGSVALFLVGTTLHLFAMTSMGTFMATLARTMPQFGLSWCRPCSRGSCSRSASAPRACRNSCRT